MCVFIQIQWNGAIPTALLLHKASIYIEKNIITVGKTTVLPLEPSPYIRNPECNDSEGFCNVLPI